MIKIDKAMPIPPSAHLGRPAKYPYASMNVGDSFFVPSMASRAGVSSRAKHFGIKITTRMISEIDPDTGKMVNGYRVWRIE